MVNNNEMPQNPFEQMIDYLSKFQPPKQKLMMANGETVNRIINEAYVR